MPELGEAFDECATAAVRKHRKILVQLWSSNSFLIRLAPILWESGIGSDVMKPIAAPIVGGMITSTIHVLILVPVFFLLIKRQELRRGVLRDHSK
jgi:Cu(I)/Ag(I) efflux system membrane protein CusA/SilA